MELNIWVAIYLTILMIALIAVGYIGDAVHKARGTGGSQPAAEPKAEEASSEEN